LLYVVSIIAYRYWRRDCKHGDAPLYDLCPYLDDTDIGGGWITGGHQPFIINTANALDKAHSIFNYIGIAAGETEKAKIVEDNKELLARLAAYKPYLKVSLNDSMSYHHSED